MNCHWNACDKTSIARGLCTKHYQRLKKTLGKHWKPVIESHGLAYSREYSTWTSMRERCGNKNCHAYRLYGGRGIKVCERWNKFSNFFADMGPRPEGHSLDRINGNGNYEPSNCRWADDFVQSQNRDLVKKIEYEGKVYTTSDIARMFGVGHSTIRKRLLMGWTIDQIFNRKIDSSKNSRSTWGTLPKEKTCPECGKIFQAPMGQRNKKTCSRECFIVRMRRVMTPVDKPAEPVVSMKHAVGKNKRLSVHRNRKKRDSRDSSGTGRD